ncbi:MAG: hypothetical protein H0T73_04515 [Ardenticatenales bacterium]|nr:hypothetical protein [Ardenticatenales bacterium]
MEIQRLTGIPTGTQVQVNDGGPAWYGAIKSVSGSNYEVRVGGTNDTSEVIRTVPATQVDFHPTVKLMNPELVMQTAIEAIDSLDIQGEVGAFGGIGGLAGQIVQAHTQIGGNQGTAAHTIAMFNYMDRKAALLGSRVDEALEAIPFDKQEERQAFLVKMSGWITAKLGDRGLWAGEDRSMIGVGAMAASDWFRRGKALLLQKGQDAQNAGKTLEGLLSSHSHGLDAKSYGRRVYSLEEFNVASLPSAVPVAAPQVNVPTPHATPGYVYYGSDYQTVLQPGALTVGQTCFLRVNNASFYEVQIGTNAGGFLTFSGVDG